MFLNQNFIQNKLNQRLMTKIMQCITVAISILFLGAGGVIGQDLASDEQPGESKSWISHQLLKSMEYQDNTGIYSGKTFNYRQQTRVRDNRETTSMTVGYIDDEFNLISDSGSPQFRYNGELLGLMINNEQGGLKLTYGTAGAEVGDGDIRSIGVDLRIGGNAYLFREFFGLPVGVFVPIGFNFGYRNLKMQDHQQASFDRNVVNLGTGEFGLGFGAKTRVPTGLPLLEDNLVGYFSWVRSVGGLTDFTSEGATSGEQDNDVIIDGFRLTRNTDLNIEGKLERFLGDRTGVTVGLTIRWMSWSDESSESFFSDIIDVVTGDRDDLVPRAKQTFLRVGINW